MLLSKIILLGELSSFLTEIPSFMHNYPGRRTAAYGRAIPPANTCVARNSESRTNEWHQSQTSCKSTLTSATNLTVKTGSSRERLPEWLLLLLSMHILQDCWESKRKSSWQWREKCTEAHLFSKANTTALASSLPGTGLQKGLPKNRAQQSLGVMFRVSSCAYLPQSGSESRLCQGGPLE